MNKNIKCNCDLAMYIRGFFPVPGFDFRKLILVELKPGESVAKHEHHGHTVLFYPEAVEPVIITPSAGMMVYIPPHTKHEVPAVESDRMSIAMIVEAE